MQLRNIYIIFTAIFFVLTLCGTVTAATPHTTNPKLVSSTLQSDLVVTYVSAPERGVKGNNITIPNTVKNQGTKISGGFWVNFYLKINSTSPNIYIGRRYVTSLDVGASNPRNTKLKVPINITAGSYYVRVYADYNNNVTESVETNNYMYSPTKVKIINCRPIYITSDNIKNLDTDTQKVNDIVNGLRTMGLYAVNWGIGPNKHYSVLNDVDIPQNALIVNIYGGLCAGTIWEMNLPYYKNKIGNRSIFSIWINTMTDINNVTFLARSHDDNFTPIYGETNGFPDVYDVNHDGKIDLPGEDGIFYPARLLTSWGFNFFYLQSGDVATLVSRIFEEAIKF